MAKCEDRHSSALQWEILDDPLSHMVNIDIDSLVDSVRSAENNLAHRI